MKKLKSALLLIFLLCLLPVCTALAKTGRVTASSLNMRKSASSDSKVVGTLREGDKVTIKDSKGSWYKVSKGSKTGYVYKKYIDVSGSGSSSSGSKSSGNKKSSKSSGNSDGTCGPGDSGSAVKKVQQRLKKLGYYTGSADGDYGGGTKAAVKNFQKRNGLKATGTVNKKTLSKLNSSGAKKAKASDAAGGDSGKGAGSTERLQGEGYQNGNRFYGKTLEWSESYRRGTENVVGYGQDEKDLWTLELAEKSSPRQI